MFKRNTAVTGFGIGHFINATTGASVTTGTPTCQRTLDGAGGACANAASYNSDGDIWEIDLAAGDMDGDMVCLSFTLADCLPIAYAIKTVAGVPDGDGRFPADTKAIDGSVTSAERLKLSTQQIVLGTVSDAVISPTTTVFSSAVITEATTNHFFGRVVIFTSGNLLYQARAIVEYELSGGEGRFTVSALTDAPASGDTFIIV